MGRRSRFAAGPLRLAVWPAIVLLVSGAAPVSARAGDHGNQRSVRMQAAVFEVPPPYDGRSSCPAVSVSPGGVCPLPPTSLWTRGAVISLCSESLCGRGFPPRDTIVVLATKTGGSTVWRTVTDRAGNFRSPLPAPLCHFAPVGLSAFDSQSQRSNHISLATTGCEPATP